MRILIIHEIDWIKKVIFEPQHYAELFSIKGHDVYVMDCRDACIKKINEGFHTVIMSNFNRVYKDASITLVRPSALLIKGLNRLSHFFTCQNVIKKIILEHNIDIILLYGMATNGIQAIKIAKELHIPVIARVLDIAHGLIKIPLVKQLAKRNEQSVLRNATKTLAITKELSDYAIEMGTSPNNVMTFPLGINSKIFSPMKKDSELAESLGISKEDVVIFFMGTIYDFAGLEKIISEFEIIKNKVQHVKFLIVGGGPSFNNVQSLVKKKKLESTVILTGFKPQHELLRYISLADICVNPFEVNYVTDRILPTKILEYFACAKAVLSTPLKGIRGLFPNEDFGIIYAPTDKFVETLSILITDKEKLSVLGEKGYSYVIKNHDWQNLTDKLLGEFKQMIKK